MPKLIKGNQIIDDHWQIVREASALGSDNQIIALPLWLANKETLKRHTADIGLLLTTSDELENIKDDLMHFPIIAIEFPVFSDGRGYTLARLLRERYQYQGEIRAIGDVLQDQLFYLKRCGFDAFAIREDKNIEAATKGLSDFSNAYQGSVDQPLPLFRRR